MASRFIHLHTHSHYSFLQALPKICELVQKAKAEDMDALALTDTGNLHGAIEFYQAATKDGVKPIIGLDTYVAPRSHLEKDPNLDAKRSRIVLLAEDFAGYQNLIALVTTSWMEGFFERPRIDKELLRTHAKGLIAVIPSFAGDIAQAFKAGDAHGARATLAELREIFAPDYLYLEVTHHPKVAGHEERMNQVVALARETNTKVVAAHDVYYLEPDDREATEILRRIGQGDRGRNEQEDFSFISEARAVELFKDIPDAIENTRIIADRCTVELTLGTFIFPKFALPKDKTADDVLREHCMRGIEARKLEGKEDVLERLNYELEIIKFKDYAAYFLVVEDLIRFAREHDIYYNIRGSVAGSMTTYLLQITKLDPLVYNIPFERFLNPERPSAPDIDMDFADNRRDEVIAYAREKYGDDHVAQIGTFGTMMARAAVRDVARALGHSYSTGDRIAKLIPPGSQGFPMTIDKALELEPDLKTLYDEDEDAHEVIDFAQRIEGCVRHVGVHAAGVVISPTPLIEWTPLQPDPKNIEKTGGKLITQYDMYSVGEDGVGLTKFDFLGIKNLSILADAVRRVEETSGVKLDIEAIPLDDKKTFAMLAKGDTDGTFQLNGAGMTRWLKELCPTTIHDVNAMVALYRPGPMQFIPKYIECKRNPRLITYLDPAIEPILRQTYGVLVYQDDLLIMANKFAGYSWGEVDKFRKAVGKKIPELMQQQKEKFINGCVNHSKWPLEKAKRVWEWIEPFAAYGFNKAHSASYGRVAYQTAYLKANYPVEYLAALLTADSGDTEQVAIFVAEAKRLNIPVLPPDVNESGTDFTVVQQGEAIRFGLSSIKNFGEGISTEIINERKTRGPYTSLSDFLSRVGSSVSGGSNLNRKSLESLIKCGALDSLCIDAGGRGTLLLNIETMLSYHREATAVAPQDSLFGAMPTPNLTLPPAKPTSLIDKLTWEKELLGIYVSGHPLDAYIEKVKRAGTTIERIKADARGGISIILPVLVTTVRTIVTKSGEKMAFLTVEDATSPIEAVIFPRLYKEHAATLTSGSCLLVKGKVSLRNGEVSLALDDLKPL